MMRPYRVAVVGAGIAGLAAARSLSEQGLAVTVLERGRGPGGRTAHRRRGAHSFDHGAQYFTARDARFAEVVASWLQAGVVAPWQGRIVSLQGAVESISPAASIERYVGVPGMNAMAKHLAQTLEVSTECAVTNLTREAGLWQVDTGDGERLGPFDALILAMPPEQAARLLLPAQHLLDAAKDMKLLPCWCAMVAFDDPLAIDFDGAFVNCGPGEASIIDWLARDSSKPGRPQGERWVIHASAAWSASRLGEHPDVIARTLLEQFFAVLGIAPGMPAYLAGHRWSFARPDGEGLTDCLWSPQHTLALCGDWCHGGRVEGAWMSGVAAAEKVIAAASGHQGTG